MKILIAIVVIIVGMMVANNYLKTGEIGFNTTQTEEERELRSLNERIQDALRAYRVAGRASSMGGSADELTIEATIDDVHKIERDLEKMKLKVKTPQQKAELQRLERKLAEAKLEMGIA